MTYNLIDSYKWHRQHGSKAHTALILARQDISINKKRYPSTHIFRQQTNHSFKSGSSILRWVEDPSSIGLRFVGYADEIKRSINHKGWFTNEYQDEVLRGVVYQWPSRNHMERFVYGYADPCNKGSCALDFDVTDDKDDAAIWADSIAEHTAEEEREYNAAADARMRFDDLADEVKNDRQTILELCREIKLARRECLILRDLPNVIAGLKQRICSLLDDIRESREKRAELQRDFSYHSGWNQS